MYVCSWVGRWTAVMMVCLYGYVQAEYGALRKEHGKLMVCMSVGKYLYVCMYGSRCMYVLLT